MANESVAESQAAVIAMSTAANDLDCARNILSQLGELFFAIKSAQHQTSVKELASLGQYVAQDWSNTMDGQQEAAFKALAAMREARA